MLVRKELSKSELKTINKFLANEISNTLKLGYPSPKVKSLFQLKEMNVNGTNTYFGSKK